MLNKFKENLSWHRPASDEGLWVLWNRTHTSSTMSQQDDSKDDQHDHNMLAPGFRFHPTKVELVEFYLRPKVEGKRFNVELITFLDLYRYDPWELPALAAIGEKEWYFYVPRDRKYRNGDRPNRGSISGYWKATGADRMIRTGNSRAIGLKKTLVFYKGEAPKGTRTNWIMNEYLLPHHETERLQKAEISLCHVYMRAATRASSSRGMQSDKKQHDAALHAMERFQALGGQSQQAADSEKMSENSGSSSTDVVTALGFKSFALYEIVSFNTYSYISSLVPLHFQAEISLCRVYKRAGVEDTAQMNSSVRQLMEQDDAIDNGKNIGSAEQSDTACTNSGKKSTKREPEITREDLQKHFGRKVDDVAESFGVSRSTFKRICRENGIPQWPRRKIGTVNDSLSMQDPPPQDGQATVAHMRLSAAGQDGCTDIERRFTSHPSLVDHSSDLIEECMTILNNIEGINDTVYYKTLRILHDDYGWRKIFLDIPAHRRKGWVLSL